MSINQLKDLEKEIGGEGSVPVIYNIYIFNVTNVTICRFCIYFNLKKRTKLN